MGSTRGGGHHLRVRTSKTKPAGKLGHRRSVSFTSISLVEGMRKYALPGQMHGR